jgi:hypothetical protein
LTGGKSLLLEGLSRAGYWLNKLRKPFRVALVRNLGRLAVAGLTAEPLAPGHSAQTSEGRAGDLKPHGAVPSNPFRSPLNLEQYQEVIW